MADHLERTDGDTCRDESVAVLVEVESADIKVTFHKRI